MGILLLNIVSFALPRAAYSDPTVYGGATGANWWAWAIAFVLADGKMRGLFTMLFGASTILIADRALPHRQSPARRHYARMVSLLAIGMVHAYLIWSGDILVLYALAGMIVFLAWRWEPPRLLAVAVLLLATQLVTGALDHAAARAFEARATAPAAPPALREQWADYRHSLDQLRRDAVTEVQTFRGGWAEIMPARIAITAETQRTGIPQNMPDTIALMLLGMALYRSGFFSGAWASRHYRAAMIVGYGICLPLYIPLVLWIDRSHFDPITLLLTDRLHLALLRPFVTLAHAALIVTLVGRAPGAWWPARLAAVGRVAFSNYLGASLVGTFLFYGYGLGWFGHLSRWQLYPVVLALWAVMLLWSPWWLRRFAYGPLEWLWRSLSRGHWQRMRHTPS